MDLIRTFRDSAGIWRTWRRDQPSIGAAGIRVDYSTGMVEVHQGHQSLAEYVAANYPVSAVFGIPVLPTLDLASSDRVLTVDTATVNNLLGSVDYVFLLDVGSGQYRTFVQSIIDQVMDPEDEWCRLGLGIAKFMWDIEEGFRVGVTWHTSRKDYLNTERRGRVYAQVYGDARVPVYLPIWRDRDGLLPEKDPVTPEIHQYRVLIHQLLDQYTDPVTLLDQIDSGIPLPGRFSVSVQVEDWNALTTQEYATGYDNNNTEVLEDNYVRWTTSPISPYTPDRGMVRVMLSDTAYNRMYEDVLEFE